MNLLSWFLSTLSQNMLIFQTQKSVQEVWDMSMAPRWPFPISHKYIHGLYFKKFFFHSHKTQTFSKSRAGLQLGVTWQRCKSVLQEGDLGANGPFAAASASLSMRPGGLPASFWLSSCLVWSVNIHERPNLHRCAHCTGVYCLLARSHATQLYCQAH